MTKFYVIKRIETGKFFQSIGNFSAYTNWTFNLSDSEKFPTKEAAESNFHFLQGRYGDKAVEIVPIILQG